MSYRPSSPAHVRTRVDVSLLSVSDRACLRLLEYSRVCTAGQLATLIYPSLRTALRRTRKLHLDNLVTRESLPADRGGIPLAYRLSSTGRRRIHLNAYRSPGLITTRHSLDGVEFVASLVRHDPGLVQLWWPEWLIHGYDWGVNPDHLVVIDTGEASALILVEVDESTERPPVIRERLNAYAKLFEDHRVGWHLLWVANSRERLARLRQIAGPTKDAMLAGRCWGVAIDDVSDRGADAEVVAIGAGLYPRPLHGIATDPKARRTSYPVGSPSWVRLLANGGREDISGLWLGVDRLTSDLADVPATQRLPNMTDSPDTAAAPSQSTARASKPTGPVKAATLPAHLDDDDSISPQELVGLILDSRTELNRLRHVGELLAKREEWPRLLYLAEHLCGSLRTDKQLLGIELGIRSYVAANYVFRLRLHSRLVSLTDHGHESQVVQAAREALATLPSRVDVTD